VKTSNLIKMNQFAFVSFNYMRVGHPSLKASSSRFNIIVATFECGCGDGTQMEKVSSGIVNCIQSKG
jgi:hypothetical protein